MKHVVIGPGGSTYLTVYVENGMLQLRLPNGYALHIDAKTISQLVGILQELKKDVE
jgi:hypothetical protein